jgi:hypothetical protein
MWLVLAPQSQPALAAAKAVVTEVLGHAQLERRAEAAFARWHVEPTSTDSMQPASALDGRYAGTVTRADGRSATFEVMVAGGIGSGTYSKVGCGTAPLALRVTSTAEVSGMVLVFSESCVKTELTIRGRAAAGILMLRLGSQYVELSKGHD